MGSRAGIVVGYMRRFNGHSITAPIRAISALPRVLEDRPLFTAGRGRSLHLSSADRRLEQAQLPLPTRVSPKFQRLLSGTSAALFAFPLLFAPALSVGVQVRFPASSICENAATFPAGARKEPAGFGFCVVDYRES